MAETHTDSVFFPQKPKTAKTQYKKRNFSTCFPNPRMDHGTSGFVIRIYEIYVEWCNN